MKQVGFWFHVLWGAILLGVGIRGLFSAPGERTLYAVAMVGGFLFIALSIATATGDAAREHPERVSCGGLPWPPRLDGRMQEGVARLEALGFRPVGMLWQRLPLRFKGRPHLVLAAADLMAYCSVLSWRRPPKFYFMTPFRDGACIITANYTWTDIERSNCIEGWVSSEDPGEVLEVHVQDVKRFLDAGRQPIPAFTLEGRVRACEEYWQLHGWKKLEKWATGKDPG